MNENLIAGYLAYTTADEFAADAVGDAPASPLLSAITLSIASAASGVSVSQTVQHGC